MGAHPIPWQQLGLEHEPVDLQPSILTSWDAVVLVLGEEVNQYFKTENILNQYIKTETVKANFNLSLLWANYENT